jgi:hypothetical protein
VGHISGGRTVQIPEIRSGYKMLDGKIEGKETLWKPMRRWQIIVRIGLERLFKN